MMGKIKADQKVFQNKDIFHRLNFLYQTSHMMATQFPDNQGISTRFANLMTNVAKKSTLRLEPNVKRTLCKGCSNILIPGVTARVRLHKKSKQWLVWTCLRCGTVKKFFTQRGHKLWYETSEAIVNVIKIGNPSKATTTQKGKKKKCKVENIPVPSKDATETIPSVQEQDVV